MQFPGVLANDDISLEIRKGEVFALVGENGAGKSMLMNLLYGIYTPTSGEIFIRGKRMEKFNPKYAIAEGVGMVHQHFMLVPSFTAAQNIVIRKEPKKLGLFYDNAEAVRRTKALVEEYGLEIDPEAKVSELSVGLQQRVEILKALYRGADVLILDEPTAVLTPQETDELFEVLRAIVREKQMTIILITHKLNEVMAISDRVGVMRKGRLVDVKRTAEVDQRMIASMMVGRPVLFSALEKTGEPGEVRIEVEHLSALDDRGLPAVNDLSLQVRAGEVLGIAAIEGNGQSELLEAVTGLRKAEQGSVRIYGKDVTNLGPEEVREAGLAHVPEDRLKTGLSAEATVSENLLAGREREKRFRKPFDYLDRSSVARYAEELYEKFDLRGAGVSAEAGELSGGNMQKVVIAREFSFDTEALVVAQPTRGVDVGAIEFIHSRIIEKRNQGCAILLSSADLDEVFRLSDRIVTLYEGRITGEFDAQKVTREEVGYYMTGSREEAQHETA